MVSDDWYYAYQRKQAGPFTLREMTEHLRTIQNVKDVLVWREGFSAWRKAGDVPELKVQKVKPPPLPPEPATMKPGDGRNNSQGSISRASMISVTAVAALVLSVALEAESILSASGSFTRLAGGIVGQAFALFAVSWIVAGAAYLISLRKMSRKSMIVTSVLVSVIVAYFSYKGRSVSWVTETVMPLAKVATAGTEWGTEDERRFFKAIHEGEAEIVRRYLQAGMSANSAAGFGMPPLYLAQMQNHSRVMMILIQHGADLNAKFGPTQRTALHDAALGRKNRMH